MKIVVGIGEAEPIADDVRAARTDDEAALMLHQLAGVFAALCLFTE